MPPDIAVCEQRPPVRRRVLPPLVPGALGHLAGDAVDGFVGGLDAVHVWGEADDGGEVLAWSCVFAVEGEGVLLVVAGFDAEEVPCFCEAGEEGTGD